MKKTAIFLILYCLLSGAAPLNAQPALKDAFRKYFLVGASLNRRQFTGEDQAAAALVVKQFNTISPENVLKWGSVHPAENRYDFADADRYVEFGVKNKMFVIGHTLVWHNQTPEWVFEDSAGRPATRELLLARMREHIRTVVGHYKGKIKGWDVVNEALSEDGTLRPTKWLKIIGEDYIAEAFRFAREADPKAELYYNDYSLENEAKRRGAVKLIKNLQAQKIPVTAVGLQGHDNFEFPTPAQQEMTIEEFAGLKIKVNITELDVDVLPKAEGQQNSAEINDNFQPGEKLNPYRSGLPESAARRLADRYAELFRIFVKYKKSISRVTFWNVTDGDSWKNDFPVRGRTNYPLLFDRNYQPKTAFYSVIKIVQ